MGKAWGRGFLKGKPDTCCDHATRNQSTRASDLAGLIFLRGGVAGFCRVSSQRACVACASPLPPQAPGRAPGCPRCATLPGPQGHPGLPPPPTVPRLSGSQSLWYPPPPHRATPRRYPAFSTYLENSRQGSQRFWSRPPGTQGPPH